MIKQSGRATYPLLLRQDSSIKDGFVEVKFKAIGGSEDRAAGIVWRAKDANTYYVLRANALEDNFVSLQDRQRRAQADRHCRAERQLRDGGSYSIQHLAYAARRLQRDAFQRLLQR